MAIEIKVPAMGESIAEATIGQIFVQEGALVKVDAEILELETDKVNQPLYAPKEGQIRLLVKPGDRVKIGQTIGLLEESAGASPPKEVPPQAPEKVPQPEKMGEKSEKPLRLTKEAFTSMPQKEEKLPPPPLPLPLPKGERESRKPLTKIRRVIAARLVEAQKTMAMLSTFNEADLSHIIALREKYQEAFTKKYGTKLGFMSFFVKSVVSALKAYPQVNAYLEGEDLVQRHYYDIGIAVGTEKGTFVPVIRNCDQLSFAEIEQSIDRFATKAREGKIAPDDMQGGSFTITNGGIYGSLLSTPILNPPQCGILGMHKIEKRPVAIEDQVIIRPMMYLALSYDHRLIDGKDSVSFLVHIKKCLEDPSSLLLEV